MQEKAWAAWAEMEGDMSSSTGRLAVLTPLARQRLGWLGVVAGACSLALGLAAVVWPQATLLVVAVLFGAQIVVLGVRRIATGIVMTSLDGWVRALSVVIGVLVSVAGLVCIRKPFTSLAVIVVLISVSWLLDGAGDLIRAFSTARGAGERGLLVGGGLFSVLGALALLFWPGLALKALTVLGGWILVALGLVQLASAARVLRARDASQPTSVDGSRRAPA